MDKPEVQLRIVADQPITAQERGESRVKTNNDLGGVVQNVGVCVCMNVAAASGTL